MSDHENPHGNAEKILENAGFAYDRWKETGDGNSLLHAVNLTAHALRAMTWEFPQYGDHQPSKPNIQAKEGPENFTGPRLVHSGEPKKAVEYDDQIPF